MARLPIAALRRMPWARVLLIARLLARGDLPLRLSVSATTRPPRKGEQDGVHYYFWTRAQFERELEKGEFLEHAQVHGNYYGTLKREVEPYRRQRAGVLLDIDVQGAEQVRRKYPEATSIFLSPPNLAALEERLRRRGTLCSIRRYSAWNNLLRGGASLLLRSEEKSWPDWNGSKGRELNSQDQPPCTRCARAVVKRAQLGGAKNAFRRNRRS